MDEQAIGPGGLREPWLARRATSHHRLPTAHSGSELPVANGRKMSQAVRQRNLAGLSRIGTSASLLSRSPLVISRWRTDEKYHGLDGFSPIWRRLHHSNVGSTESFVNPMEPAPFDGGGFPSRHAPARVRNVYGGGHLSNNHQNHLPASPKSAESLSATRVGAAAIPQSKA